jgi:predicted dehydrogenase
MALEIAELPYSATDADPVRFAPPLTVVPPPPSIAPALPVRVGIVGYGYWGPNVVRNYAEVEGAEVAAVCDGNLERLAQAKARYPGVNCISDCRELINDPAIDAVIIMTPVSSHFPLALAALKAGKHVLVAKPIAASIEEATELIEEARRQKRTLMVDHTFIYTGAVRTMKETVDQGRLGRLYYYDSVRVNLGLVQPDVNVLWDLAVHDLAIMDYVLGVQPCAVAATGAAHIPGKPVNTAYLTCFFENDLIAHHHVNWLAPVKIRRTLLCGDRQMIVYDDLEPSEKVKIYDKGITLSDRPEGVYQSMVGYRTGDMWAPKLSLTEGLRVEAEHFLDCIREGRQPLSDGEAGLRVVKILEAATKSLAQRGQPVELSAMPLSTTPALHGQAV